MDRKAGSGRASYPPFSKDAPMLVELAGGYVLRSAPERAFGVHYAIYRQANPDFEDFLEYGSDLEGLNYCFWVEQAGERIGGVIIRPNHIEGLFLIPPRVDRFDVLRRILPALLAWSDGRRAVEAVDVTAQELGLYQRLGFHTLGGRRVYIRPTEALPVDWPGWCRVACPSPADAAAIAKLFHAAYRHYPGRLASLGVDEWRQRVGRTFSSEVQNVCHQASSLVRHSQSGAVVGACIVRLSRQITQPEAPIPKVSDIAVHPEHRRCKIGTQMMRRALAALAGEFPTLRFGVAMGNPAEAFYYRLGFLPGPPQYTLVRGPKRARDPG